VGRARAGTGRPRSRAVVLTGALLALAAAGCGEEQPLRPAPEPDRPVHVVPEYDAERELAPTRAALALVPAEATVVTVTDFDEARAQLGVPDLTSEDLMADRTDFWERAPGETVLLAEGMLRDASSELMLDHGFTQDDVDWEARWVTDDGTGWALGFRPDLDMSAVRRAVEAGVAGLGGAEVDAEQHLVTSGAAGADEESWGDRPDVEELSETAPAESTYYRSACIPVAQALGPDADARDLAKVTKAHDVTDLEPLDAFSLTFRDGVATARLGLERHGVGRPDLFERVDLAEDWPTVEGLTFTDGFSRPTADPSTGRIGWAVADPAVAARLTLTDLLPFAVCNEVTPFPEPTGP
jgi:hypothetical protein